LGLSAADTIDDISPCPSDHPVVDQALVQDARDCRKQLIDALLTGKIRPLEYGLGSNSSTRAVTGSGSISRMALSSLFCPALSLRFHPHLYLPNFGSSSQASDLSL
jgi:hypothetical protein